MSRSGAPAKPKRGRRPRNPDSTNVPISPYTEREAKNSANSSAAPHEASGGEQLERIQKIAAELFAAKGYRAIGVAEIGDAVGLGRGALYYHISSKEDLLFNVIVRYIENLVVAGREAMEVVPDPRQRIRVLSRHLMQSIFSNRSEMTLCFRESDCLTGQRHRIVSELHKSYRDIWAATLLEGERKGVFRPLSTVAVKGLLGMYFYSVLWIKPGGKSSPNDVADEFANMTLAVAEGKSR